MKFLFYSSEDAFNSISAILSALVVSFSVAVLLYYIGSVNSACIASGANAG